MTSIRRAKDILSLKFQKVLAGRIILADYSISVRYFYFLNLNSGNARRTKAKISMFEVFVMRYSDFYFV